MILLAGDRNYLVFNQIKTAEALVPCLETFIIRTRQTAARLSIQSDAVYFVAILITLGKILRIRQTGVHAALQRAVRAHGFRQKPVEHSAIYTTLQLHSCCSGHVNFPWLKNVNGIEHGIHARIDRPRVRCTLASNLIITVGSLGGHPASGRRS